MKQTQKITPKISDKFEPGAILNDSWGWDQTNVDFYCIIERKGEWVTVLPMSKETSPEIGFMTNDVTPLKINFNAKPIRKKLKTFDGKESGFSFRNYTGGGWCNLWKGKPVNETHYA
jgi:hypothetical protein